MRYARLLLLGLLGAFGFMLIGSQQAFASFHCMRIHAVMAGFNGDSTIQYVELRLAAGSQNFVGGHKIRFYDASNTLKAVFTFPTNATNGLAGDSILIGTSEFNMATTGGDANFPFAGNTVGMNGGDANHPVQSTGGKVMFAGEVGDFDCAGGSPPADSVGYGAYTGPIDFGTGPAPALPGPSTNQALRLGNLNLNPSNNATEYSLQNVSATTFSVPTGMLTTDLNTPRNNQRVVLQLSSLATPTPPPSTPGGVGGLAGPPDGTLEGASSDAETWVVVLVALAGAGAATAAGAAWYAARRRAG